MKNITTDDFRFGMFCSITAITVVILAIIGAVVLDSRNNHNFDMACVNSGKKLTYITVEGDDYSRKVCQ
jgi:hypothetical protein